MSAAANPSTVRMPCFSKRADTRDPTPHSAIVGRCPITSTQFSAVSR